MRTIRLASLTRGTSAFTFKLANPTRPSPSLSGRCLRAHDGVRCGSTSFRYISMAGSQVNFLTAGYGPLVCRL
jgi:hypothetical protein